MASATIGMIRSIADEIEAYRAAHGGIQAENAEMVMHIMDRVWDDVTMLSDEQSDAAGMVTYELAWRVHQRGQKRALPLLRRFLTRQQRRDLRRRGVFTIIGAAGGIYQLAPHAGTVFGDIVQTASGKRWRSYAVYCYHDPEKELPSADVALGQMLLLMTDEPAFLAEANKTVRVLHPVPCPRPRVGVGVLDVPQETPDMAQRLWPCVVVEDAPVDVRGDPIQHDGAFVCLGVSEAGY